MGQSKTLKDLMPASLAALIAPTPAPSFVDPRFREERPPTATDLVWEVVKGALGIGGQQPIGSNLDRAQAAGEMVSMAGVPIAAAKKALAWPSAGDVVGGLRVRPDVPNTGSIGASFDDGEYEVQRGIRAARFDDFGDSGPPKFYSKHEEERTKRLAADIGASREINPLIIAIDEEGPYVLEGGHRFDALKLMGIKEFPAMVIDAVKKYGIAAAVSAGLLSESQARQMREQGIK